MGATAPARTTKKGGAAERKRRKFLELVAAGQPVTRAAEAAKIPRRTLYDWRDADPDFAAAWEKAWERGADDLEDELHTRAHAGPDDPMSGTLLIFSLKGRRPDRYRDNVRHQVDARLTVDVVDAREQLEARLLQIEEHREQRALPPGPQTEVS